MAMADQEMQFGTRCHVEVFLNPGSQFSSGFCDVLGVNSFCEVKQGLPNQPKTKHMIKRLLYTSQRQNHGGRFVRMITESSYRYRTTVVTSDHLLN